MGQLTYYLRRYIKGIATRNELRELHRMLGDGDTGEVEKILQEHWRNAMGQTVDNNARHEVQQAFARLWQRLHAEPVASVGTQRRLWIRRIVSYMAAACFIGSMGMAVVWYLLPTEPSFNMIRVTSGNPPQKYILPDGTVVWLNPGTTLEYQEDFTDHRNIRLSGQAYFEVTTNRNCPFKVVFNSDTLQVTGTKFMITGYPLDSISGVHLREGSVRVYGRSGTASMLADEYLAISRNKGYTKKALVFGSSADWTVGRMSFNHTQLTYILKHLERRYNVHFLNKEKIDTTIPLTVSLHNGLDNALESLSILTEIKYERKDSSRIEMSRRQRER